MRKILTLAIAFGMIAFANTSSLTASSIGTQTLKPKPFMKKADGTWAANHEGKTYWYKLDKEASLWWSTDGKKWAKVESGMWADKSGRWLKIGENKLWWSADMGKTWSEVPEWKWEGPRGEWYKFDANWQLWSV